MNLNKDARIVGAGLVASGVGSKPLELLVVMSKGYGKRTSVSAYKVQKRGGRGILTAHITAKTGALVSAHVVTRGEHEEIIAVSRKGQVIRTPLSDISLLGRATQGVRIMKLGAGDTIASVVTV